MRVRPSVRMAGTIASAAWLLVTLLACGHGYEAGTLEGSSNETGGEIATSCLEMRVSRHSDERLRELGWVGVQYELGNACDGAVPVDLREATVFATPVGGLRHDDPQDGALPAPVYYSNEISDTPILLSPWDPQEVIREGMLDGRRRAREVIAYVVPPGFAELNVCVEVASVLGNEADPVCFYWGAS